MKNFKEKAGLIWRVVDLLRGDLASIKADILTLEEKTLETEKTVLDS
ncbi:hypothetical protein V6R21_23415 [Limibacter armeniacum]